MAENTSVQTSNVPSEAKGKPLLKKVKRPVKKLVKRPLSPMNAANPLSSQPAGGAAQGAAFRSPLTQVPTGAQPRRVFDSNIDFDNMDDIKSIVAEMSDNGEQNNASVPPINMLPEKVSRIQKTNQEAPKFIDDSALERSKPESVFSAVGMFSSKVLLSAVLCALVLGFIFSQLFFSEQKVVSNGLQGVVSNPEVPRGRARCGIAEKTQGCVLYIMNPQREDLNARDFYDLASQLTGRQRFVIETGNMRYSNVKIGPGEIAQFNIPPLQ